MTGRNPRKIYSPADTLKTAQQSRIEEVANESETRFRLVADTAPVLIWMSGVDKLCTYFNKPWLDFTGRSLEQEFGNGWAEGVHPDDLQRSLNTYTQSFERREKFRMEYRLRRHDREYRWILDIGVPRFNQDRSFAGYIGIAVDVTERKTAEGELLLLNRTLEERTVLLQSREELLKIFVKNVPAGVAMLDRDMRYLQVSDRFCKDYSADSSQLLGRSHYEVFPDIPENWKEMHRRALEGEILRAEEDQWNRKDGTVWVRWEIRPWKTSSGSVGGILIFAEEISQRKQMEEALSGISLKLIEAQEQERTRIARELHDDIAQRLALVTVELGRLRESPPRSKSELHERVGAVQKYTVEIANDVQAIAHKLHSSKLEYLGVVAAMKGFCKEFGEQQRAEIDFRNSDLPTHLSPEVALCLFRVLQEALHNAAKHSGVRRFDVQLREDSGEIHLDINDSGRGFDVSASMHSQGLGLVSMRERVRLVDGTIEIDSGPTRGTSIHVHVPIASQHLAARRKAVLPY
jgi:PAS domain S-box-containing protein